VLRRLSTDKLRRKVLAPLGYNLDLDFDLDHQDRVVSRPQEALILVSGGFDLLLRITEPEVFPSLSRAARRRGSRLIRRDIVYGGHNASIFLAVALGELLARTGQGFESNGSADPGPGPEHYRALRAAVEDYFTINTGRGGRVLSYEELMEPCLVEFLVMEKREPNRLVNAGQERASRYNAMLLEGADPERDAEVVEEQRRYARDYFMNKAAVWAVTLSLTQQAGGGWMHVEPDLLDLGKVEPDARKVVAHRKRSLAAWREGASHYLEYARAVTGGPRPVGGGGETLRGTGI
jgi:hypothetical protein